MQAAKGKVRYLQRHLARNLREDLGRQVCCINYDVGNSDVEAILHENLVRPPRAGLKSPLFSTNGLPICRAEFWCSCSSLQSSLASALAVQVKEGRRKGETNPRQILTTRMDAIHLCALAPASLQCCGPYMTPELCRSILRGACSLTLRDCLTLIIFSALPALRRYRDIWRYSRLFVWSDETGVPWWVPHGVRAQKGHCCAKLDGLTNVSQAWLAVA